MSELASSATTDWSIKEKSDQAVIAIVERVLKLTEDHFPQTDRRKDNRAPFPHLLSLIPIADQELRVTGDVVTVVGKQLAGRGLDFFHCDPLPFKRAIVSFDNSLLQETHFILSIAWCRFLRSGWYDSGGRFTHIVTPNPTIAST